MNFKVDEGEEGQKSELPALKLIHSLGYQYKTNFEINKERTDHRQSLLYGRLKEALKRLNRLDDDGIEDAIRQIHEDAFPANLDIVEANERVRIKLVGLSRESGLDQPVSVKQYGKNGLEYVRVKFFDFDSPANNDFLVTNQFELQGYKTKIEADIVVFVNGIPLIEIECKKPSSRDYLKEAWDDNLEKYQRMGLGFRKLFYYNHVIVAASDVAAKYGTIGAPPNAYAKWTSLYNMKSEELENLVGRIPTPQDVLLAGLLQKNSLLDMLKNFVIYEAENNRRIKKVAKHQQYRVVSECISRTQVGKTIRDKGGVVWHTQGSGKSLSMVWFATQLLFKMKNPPILIVTDRRQLDKQIHSTFQACGFPFPIKAKSKEHLAEELKNPQGKTIMTTIQKFGTPESAILSDKRIFVLVDEAHRSQFGWTATHMRDALPNAVFFAFSGTPIDKRNRSTFKEFGPLIDKYSFEESKADGATLPVKHEGRLSNLFVEDGESIDIIFERVFKDLPAEKRAELKKKYVNKEDIAEAPHRIKKIVEDLIVHFNTTIGINGYKGMVVCTSRDAAVIYKKELDKQGGPPSKIIMTSEPDEVGKDGASWREYYLSKEEREIQSEKFKDPNDPTKLLIVVDMLLVGYDVPVVQVMYLDKNLKEHALLQAMARVNRLYDAAKTYGLLVDYIGISKNLQKALEIFEKEDIQGAFDTLEHDLVELEARYQLMKDLIGELKDKDNSDILLRFQTEDSQVELESAFKGFTKALDAVLPRKEASKYKKDFDFACYVRSIVRAYYHGDKPNDSEYSRKIQQLIDDYVKSSGVTVIMNPREITYENFLAHAAKLKKDSAKAALVRNKAMQVIRELEHTNPGYYGKLKEKLEKLIIEEKERVLNDAAYFDLYGQIYKQAIGGKEITEKESGIKDEFERALFYLLKGKIDDEKLCRSISSIVSKETKKETKKVDWEEKTEVTNKIFLTAYDNLPETLSKEAKDELSEEVLRLAGVHFGK
ncbi:MAG: type I restriction endonuclease subunit R [Candidatus Nitrosotenuis sp.]